MGRMKEELQHRVPLESVTSFTKFWLVNAWMYEREIAEAHLRSSHSRIIGGCLSLLPRRSFTKADDSLPIPAMRAITSVNNAQSPKAIKEAKATTTAARPRRENTSEERGCSSRRTKAGLASLRVWTLYAWRHSNRVREGTFLQTVVGSAMFASGERLDIVHGTVERLHLHHVRADVIASMNQEPDAQRSRKNNNNKFSKCGGGVFCRKLLYEDPSTDIIPGSATIPCLLHWFIAISFSNVNEER